MPAGVKRRRHRWAIVLASGGFHALLALLIVMDMRRPPPASPPPVVEVWLQPRIETAKPAPSVRSEGGVRSGASPARVAAPSVEGVQVSPVTGMATLAPAPPSPAPLRGLSGCQLAGLDRLAPEARARCLERLASLDRPSPRLNLDLTGRYAHDQTPYLTRPPKNGCKPVAAVADGVNGTVDAKIGVGCAFSF